MGEGQGTEHRRLPPAEVGAEGRYLGRCTCGWRGQDPHSHEAGADADTQAHLHEAGQYSEADEHEEIYDPALFDHMTLPADVPVTLDFGQRIGTAHVTRTADGLEAQITADGDPLPLAELARVVTAMRFELYPQAEDPLPPARHGQEDPIVITMRLGSDGKWHAT